MTMENVSILKKLIDNKKVILNNNVLCVTISTLGAEVVSVICNDEEKIVGVYLKLNDEVLGALQCRLDMGIHYEGWDAQKVYECLNKYSDNYTIEKAQAILEQLIEIPTNSQIYFFTYFKITDMYEKTKSTLKDNFNELEFHQLILDCGPIPLRFVETIVDNYIEENK